MAKGNKTGKGGFKKGVSGNPGGRKKNDLRLAFEEAVKIVEKEKKKDFFKHVVECAWTDPGLMKEVLKKLVPDLKQQDVTLNASEDLTSFIGWLCSRNGDTENKG